MESGDQAPDISDALKEAIRQELSGNPDYAEGNETDQQQQTYDEAEAYLLSLGVSLDDPIEQIRAALAEQPMPGLKYGQSAHSKASLVAVLTGKEVMDFKSDDNTKACRIYSASYSAALKKFLHSDIEKSATMSPRAWVIASKLRAARFRKRALSFENAISIGLRSGE